MPIRNPFARRPGAAVAVHDENVPPERDGRNLGFERVDTVGSRASSVLSMRSAKSQDTGVYKMSVVNDSGVYLPPSPIDERAPWSRKYLTSRASSDAGSSLGDIEHFSISRESFDSYRRSFDITAKSPVVKSHDLRTRQSLDSARLQPPARWPADHAIGREPPTPEETFEDIGLDDDKPQQPRKRGFFSKFGEQPDRDAAGQPAVSRFLMHGRKRAQSGQGSELSRIERPKPSDESTR